MKKITIVTLLSVIFSSLTSIAFSGENYFQFRRAFGENDFYENYIIIEENNTSPYVAVGAKIIDLPKGLTILNPHLFYKGLGSLQLGTKYCHTSSGGDSIGPAVRFIKRTALLFIFFDSTLLSRHAWRKQ